MALPKAIMPIADDDPFARILLYGEPGVGKTVLAATSPKCLMLLNDADEGRSAANQGSSAHRWVVRDYNDLTEAVEFLRHGQHDFEWVWLDNASIFQDQGMTQIMEDLVASKPHRNLFIPDKAEYMLNQNRLFHLLKELKKLEMNIGITAHVMATEDEDGRITYKPAFQGGQGAFSEKVCGIMSVVGHLQVARRKKGDEIVQVRQLVTDKQEKFYAKDRYGVIGTMIDPTMDKIIAKIAGSKKAPAKKAAPRKAVARPGAKSTKPVNKRSATRRPATTK